VVARRIHDMLVGTAVTTLVCSAACGADILALEAAGKLGISRRVILPFERASFRESSVVDRGGSWGARFDAVLQELEADDIVELSQTGSNDEAYRAASSRILDEAVRIANDEQRKPLAAVVWNGCSRGAGDLTESFRDEALARALETVTVLTI